MKKVFVFLLLIVVAVSLFSFNNVSAASPEPPNLQIKIGDFGEPSDFKVNYGKAECPPGTVGECLSVPWLGAYIGAIYQYGVGFAAVLAVLMIMIGGVVWLTSAGSPERVGTAKDFITSAILGLVLALFSYTILFTINPALVSLKPLGVPAVADQPENRTNLNLQPQDSELATNPGCCLARDRRQSAVDIEGQPTEVIVHINQCWNMQDVSKCEDPGGGEGYEFVPFPGQDCATVSECSKLNTR